MHSFIKPGLTFRGTIGEVSFYPDKIDVIAAAPVFAGRIADADAVGIYASFQCGSFVRYFLEVEPVDLKVTGIMFQSDGCGYAVAAAETIAAAVYARGLSELHGLDTAEVRCMLENKLGTIPEDRAHCADIAIDALRSALKRFREQRAREFKGDTALICSCFGIGEDTIEQAVDAHHLNTVAEVSAATNAGSGCGSCRMIIQEMLDIRAMEA